MLANRPCGLGKARAPFHLSPTSTSQSKTNPFAGKSIVAKVSTAGLPTYGTVVQRMPFNVCTPATPFAEVTHVGILLLQNPDAWEVASTCVLYRWPRSENVG